MGRRRVGGGGGLKDSSVVVPSGSEPGLSQPCLGSQAHSFSSSPSDLIRMSHKKLIPSY